MTQVRADINLHTHLEGTVRPATAVELGAAMGLRPPPGGWTEALVMRERGSLTTFLTHVAWAYPLFATPEAVRRLVAEAIEDAANDGTRYVELRFGPATHARPGMSIDEVVSAACDGVAVATGSAGTGAGLVVCALRHHDPVTNESVARAAAAHAGKGVVGFDVAGDELRFPDLVPMCKPFEIARAADLGLTAHAAEAAPASAVRTAIEQLGVRRIGHGSRAAEDPDMLRWAVDTGVCFEVCPTSNVLTGAADSYDRHPVRAFIGAGCDVVLGDDDPTTTGSPLSVEARLLETKVGLTPDEVERLRRTSIERVFCEPSVREALRAAG